jgi:hypothetical protein
VKELISLAGLKDALEGAVRQYEFSWRWDVVIQWNEESRYRENSAGDAKALIEAIENRKYGLLQWLKKHY